MLVLTVAFSIPKSETQKAEKKDLKFANYEGVCTKPFFMPKKKKKANIITHK